MSAKRVLKALSEFQERQRHRFTPSASGGVTVAAYSRAADPRERVRQLLDPTPDPAVELANVNGLLVGFYGMFVAAGVSRWVFEFSWLGAIAVAVLTLGAGIAGGAIVGGRRSRTR
jgi:lysylphosphatidylglycerol synthetase-like protein (DUF2156 family)